MTGYLSLADEEEGRVALEGPVSVYRDPDRDDEVVAATEEREIPLGIADMTVSRTENGSAPVVVDPTTDGVAIRNAGNGDGVTVRVGNEERSVQEGGATRVSDDAIVEIGLETTLEVVVD